MPSAAILSGGRARRFSGCDKSGLRVDGRTILERQIDALRPVADDIMIVGREPVEGLAMTGCRVIADRFPEQGPLGGLETALAEATHPVVVLLACDMPYVTASLLGRLADIAADTTRVDAAVPHTSLGDHPLCAAYTRGCQDAVSRRLREGARAMKDLLRDLRVRRIDESELRQFGIPQHLLANVNTPEDYASLQGPSGGHTR